MLQHIFKPLQILLLGESRLHFRHQVQFNSLVLSIETGTLLYAVHPLQVLPTARYSQLHT